MFGWLCRQERLGVHCRWVIASNFVVFCGWAGCISIGAGRPDDSLDSTRTGQSPKSRPVYARDLIRQDLVFVGEFAKQVQDGPVFCGFLEMRIKKIDLRVAIAVVIRFHHRSSALPPLGQDRIDFFQIKGVGVKMVADPFYHFFMAIVLGVADGIKHFVIPPNPATIFWRARLLSG